ncbi:MAG: sigma-70 family RNA polymerase sigma factor [Vampirovibrionales bacterium]
MANSSAKFNQRHLEALEAHWLTQPLDAYTPKEQQQCKTAFLDAMTPYVEGVVQSMARRHSDPKEDLLQMGAIGVLKALAHYDPKKGSSFKSYASYYVTGEIRRYLREQSLLFKAPRALQELHYRMLNISKNFQAQNGRDPSDLELLNALQCEPTTLNELRHLERRSAMFSFEDRLHANDEQGLQSAGTLNDTPFSQDEASLYLESFSELQDNGGVPETEDRVMLRKALRRLAPELRDVVTLSFFEEMPQQKIAERSGVSQMQVSRRLKKALQELDRYL